MRPAFIDSLSWAMAEVYEACTDKILINLARHFPYVKDADEVMGSFQYQARMLAQMGQVNRETVEIIMQTLGGADEELRKALDATIMDALKYEEPKLRKAAEQGLLYGGSMVPPELTSNQMQAFWTYYRQSADKLNLVNTVMLESTQAAYTATVSDVVAKISNTQNYLNAATGEVVTGVSTWNTAMHDSVRKMVDNGLTGFIDHAGRRWSPEAYAAMDIRTTMFNTAREAVFERNEQYGNDLYQVSSHNGARPLCYPWQGKVISSSGRTGLTTDLDGNEIVIHSEDEIESFRYGGGLFGVNCKHYPMVFIPGVSTIKGHPQDEEENEKAYKLSQQQRGLERKLREEKRELAVMKAQGASPDQIAAQKRRVSMASADIDDFCDANGLPRRRNREYTPVDAKWPDTGTYNPADFPTDTKDRIDDWYKNGGRDPDDPSPTNIHLGDDNIPPQGQMQVMAGGGTNSEAPVVNVNADIETLRSAAVGAENKVEFWMNMDEAQQAAFKASGLSIDEAFELARDKTAIVSEWKAANPGGAGNFAIKHDYSTAEVKFNRITAKSEGWMADATTNGIINVRPEGLGEDWDFVITHEAGHQLSNMSPELERTIALNPGNVLGRYNTRVMAFDGIYGEYNPEEAFATGVSNFIRHPEAMKAKYPDAYEAIEGLFNASPSAREYVERIRSAYRKEFM